MMRYRTAEALRAALEQRLNNLAGGSGPAIQRLRKRVAFERFLVRVQRAPDTPWLLKGAFALELRFGDRARTTRDMDLGIHLAPPNEAYPPKMKVAELLRDAAALPLEDFFMYAVAGGKDILPDQEIRAHRFNLTAFLSGRVFERFSVDIGPLGSMVTTPEEIPCSDTLAFAGVPPSRYRVVSLSQQVAEKIHAFTVPWKDRENTRVKDLVDLVLILEVSPPDLGTTRKALEAVFGERASHPLPITLPDPPRLWVEPYAITARDLSLAHSTVEDAIRLLRRFWAEVFS
jgi:hypothetical protein